MARTRTLTLLRDDIRWQADQEGATLRHTDAALNRAINQSISRFREKISDNGHPYYLVSTSDTLATGAATDGSVALSFSTIDLAEVSPALVRVYGLDLTIDGVIIPLEQIEFNERARYETTIDTDDTPVAFFLYNAANIALVPPAASPYPYTLWYLPVHTDLSADSDTFDGIAGWEEWIVWDVLLKLATRDELDEMYQKGVDYLSRLEADILKKASHRSRVGPAKRWDTRGRRRLKRYLSRWAAS